MIINYMQIATKSVYFDQHMNFFSMLLLTKFGSFYKVSSMIALMFQPTFVSSSFQHDIVILIFSLSHARPCRLLRHKLEKVLAFISLKFPLKSKTYTYNNFLESCLSPLAVSKERSFSTQ